MPAEEVIGVVMRRRIAMIRPSRVLARAVLAYGTPRRLINLGSATAARRGERSVLPSYPPRVAVALTSACNLQCPFCPTGRRDPGRRPALLDLDDYRMLLAAVASRACVVPCCWSYHEPLDFGHVHDIGATSGAR